MATELHPRHTRDKRIRRGTRTRSPARRGVIRRATPSQASMGTPQGDRPTVTAWAGPEPAARAGSRGRVPHGVRRPSAL